MPPVTPYSPQLAGRDPVEAMRDSVARLEALTAPWTPELFERTYAPGKWSARQILIHLAQTELALGSRARLALATPDYKAQSFNQDAWISLDAGLSGRDAAYVLLALMRMNSAMYAGLSQAVRETPFSHPEYGALTVDWILHQSAGHHIHHLHQLQIIAGS